VLIDTWLSGDKEAFKNAIGHLLLPVLLLDTIRWPASPA
jgi:peptide/nickel transport system permease protein